MATRKIPNTWVMSAFNSSSWGRAYEEIARAINGILASPYVNEADLPIRWYVADESLPGTTITAGNSAILLTKTIEQPPAVPTLAHITVLMSSYSATAPAKLTASIWCNSRQISLAFPFYFNVGAQHLTQSFCFEVTLPSDARDLSLVITNAGTPNIAVDSNDSASMLVLGVI